MMDSFLTLTLASIGLSLLVSLIYRILTKPEEMKKIKDDMTFFREKSMEAQKAGDKAKTAEYTNEMLKASQAQMKHTMKPMIATFALFAFILGWLNTSFTNVHIAMPFAIPFIAANAKIGWFWWYFLLSLPSTVLFRKVLGVE